MPPSPSLPLASLHEPVERFRGSHAGIEAGLAGLRRLPELADALRQARAGAEAAITLFERQVLPHHADEEQDLFVAVQRSATPGAEQARVEDLVGRLVAQHRQVERMWAALRPAVQAVAAGRPAAAPDFDGTVALLIETYLAHTRLEEREFLPLADAILARNPNHLAALDVSLHLRHAPPPRAAYI